MAEFDSSIIYGDLDVKCDASIGGDITSQIKITNSPSTDSLWRHLDIGENNISLELGKNENAHNGSIKLWAYDADNFAFIRPSSGNLHIDSTKGYYYFNWDTSSNGGANGVIYLGKSDGTQGIKLSASGESAFSGGNVIVGSGVSNTARIILDVSHAGSPQISFDDTNGDNRWSIGCDDADNNFSIHGSTTVQSIIDNISAPYFEIATTGAVTINKSLTVGTNIIVGPEDGTNEGGAIFFKGAGTHTASMYVDRYQNKLRVVYDGSEKCSISNTGLITATSGLTLTGGVITSPAVSSYDKLRVWNSGSYTIGMASAQTYGYLNDYAMTFTMNNDADRGFLWRDSSDAASDGAMSLTTDGRLYLKGLANVNQLNLRSSVISDIEVKKSNAWLTLDSDSSGGNGVEQGAGISIGESGYKGSAALHLTYTGDGYGHIGMGAVDGTTGRPAYRAMYMHYQNTYVKFLGEIRPHITLSTAAQHVAGAINELFQSVSDGKSTVASAITDMGQSTASDATFDTMATKIRAIETGKKYATGSHLGSAGTTIAVTTGWRPKYVVVKGTYGIWFVCDEGFTTYVNTYDSSGGVTSTTHYTNYRMYTNHDASSGAYSNAVNGINATGFSITLENASASWNYTWEAYGY